MCKTRLWPFTKLIGGLSQLHSADDAAIAWLTKKKKKKKNMAA